MHHLEGSTLPAGYCYTYAHYAGGVNNYLNGNHTKYLAQLFGRIFAFWKINFLRTFANIVTPATDGTTKCIMLCKAHPVL